MVWGQDVFVAVLQVADIVVVAVVVVLVVDVVTLQTLNPKLSHFRYQ